jgi:hypothetical protein
LLSSVCGWRILRVAAQTFRPRVGSFVTSAPTRSSKNF